MARRWARRLGAALALATAVVGCATGGGAMSGDAATLFDLIDVIEADRAFAPAGLAELTSASFELVQKSPAQRRYGSSSVDHPAVRSVEVRAPGPEGTFGGLVILEIAEPVRIAEADVTARYDAEPDLGFPTGGPGQPVYLTYRRRWGELSFGFTRAGVLTRVVLSVDAADPMRPDSDVVLPRERADEVLGDALRRARAAHPDAGVRLHWMPFEDFRAAARLWRPDVWVGNWAVEIVVGEGDARSKPAVRRAVRDALLTVKRDVESR